MRCSPQLAVAMACTLLFACADAPESALDPIVSKPPPVRPMADAGTPMVEPDASVPVAPPVTPPVAPPVVPPRTPPLFALDFSTTPLGEYTSEQIDADWKSVAWDNTFGRVTVTEESNNRFLRVAYPKDGVGPRETGAQWWVELEGLIGAGLTELYVSYRVRFGAGFDFVRGGKLPGLLGGEGNTGGAPPDGTDGWSARMMWRPDGDVVQYVYHPDQPRTYGEDFLWDVGGQRAFPTEQWVTVEHRVLMNTPGTNDGEIQAWYDGELALDARGLRFRDVDTFAIDGFYFSTFFGGGDPTWAPTGDEHADFDDFTFSDRPITH